MPAYDPKDVVSVWSRTDEELSFSQDSVEQALVNVIKYIEGVINIKWLMQ